MAVNRRNVVEVALDAPHNAYGQFQTSENFIEDFKKNLKIEIISLDEQELVFDLVGVDASIANALRRILLAEVPTIAIENVYIWNNSSIIQDEVFAHRLGLIPINADPREFDCFPADEEGEATDMNTLVFKLDIQCSDTEKTSVYSKDLEWVPQGSQSDRFKTIKPVYDDILLAKLIPGQSIALEAHCRKGIGKDHAKFSPVSTASYRLLPEIELHDVTGKDAHTLKTKCPMDVFDIEDLGKGVEKAVVARPRNCTMCRECIRDPEWDKKVSLRRRRDHFIFSIESVGMLPPETLLQEAIRVLMEKCDAVLESINGIEPMEN